MTTTTATATTTTSKKNMKAFTAFAFDKVYENTTEAIMTLVTFAVTVAYLLAMQSITGEFIVYIGLVFIGAMILRLVHDFDDTYQIHEIGSKVETLRSVVFDLYRSSSNDNAHLTDDEIDERFSSMQ